MHEPEPTAPRPEPFEFSGEGGEFFRIWIVNVVLTILTLGIYSAWAKVRTKCYFYGHTRLAGSSFDYLASPWVILKGRLVALAVIVAASLANAVSPLTGAVIPLALVFLLPWLVCRAVAFNAANSAWRGVRFGFDGGYGEAFRTYVLWPLAQMLSFGLLIPFVLRAQHRFLLGNLRFGTTGWSHEAGVGPYYRLILVTGVIVIGALFVSSVLGGAVTPIATLIAAAGYIAAISWFQVGRLNLAFGHLRIGPHRFQSRFDWGSYLRLQIGNMLGLALTLGLFYPWAKVRNARYRTERVRLFAVDDLDRFAAAQEPARTGAAGEEIGEALGLDIGL